MKLHRRSMVLLPNGSHARLPNNTVASIVILSCIYGLALGAVWVPEMRPALPLAALTVSLMLFAPPLLAIRWIWYRWKRWRGPYR